MYTHASHLDTYILNYMKCILCKKIHSSLSDIIDIFFPFHLLSIKTDNRWRVSNKSNTEPTNCNLHDNEVKLVSKENL